MAWWISRPALEKVIVLVPARTGGRSKAYSLGRDRLLGAGQGGGRVTPATVKVPNMPFL